MQLNVLSDALRKKQYEARRSTADLKEDLEEANVHLKN